MKTIAKLISTALVVFLVSSCSKDNQIDQEKLNQFELEETINRMVVVTNEQTTALKNEISTLSSQNTKLSSEQYNGFVRSTMENYVTKLVESDPEHLENNNLQVNNIDPNEAQWSNNPDVYGGSVEQVVPPHLLARLDKLAIRLDAIIENPFYDINQNLNAGATEIENILQGEIADINKDLTLNIEEKQFLAGACMAAKRMVLPQLDFFKTLAKGAELLGEDMENYRRRSFFGRLIRAVARVVIAIVAVAVLTALVVKTAGIFGAKFALAYTGKGFTKKLLFGIAKKKASKTLKWYGAIALAGGPGVLKAGKQWDVDLNSKNWYKDFELKAKATD